MRPHPFPNLFIKLGEIALGDTSVLPIDAVGMRQCHGADHGIRFARLHRRSAPVKARKSNAVIGAVTLSHPDRVYWEDARVTKRDLAEFYEQVWKWMRPHVIGRPIALLRCPEGAVGECFFQKHASAGIATEHLHL